MEQRCHSRASNVPRGLVQHVALAGNIGTISNVARFLEVIENNG